MIYLDNSATTKVLPEVAIEVNKYLIENYGNPSSKYYSLANTSKNVLDNTRETVLKLFDIDEGRVIFTSGSTESNNFIIKGYVDKFIGQKKRIITTNVEHPSVTNTCKYLQKLGFDVVYLKVDKNGTVSLEDLKYHFNEETILVSIMWVNNEIGSVNDICSIGKYLKDKPCKFHVDATQAIGKINPELPQGVDFVSFSGHKIYGPKGVGVALILPDESGLYPEVSPLLHGGEQEYSQRAGTQSVHNIAGLGKAVELCIERLETNIEKLSTGEKIVLDILRSKLGDRFKQNNNFEKKVPGLINFQIIGVKNELFLKKASEFLAASTGSACSITHPSHTLKAIGLTADEISYSIRISLSPYDDEYMKLIDLL